LKELEQSCLLNIAVCKLKRGDFKEVISATTKVIEADPNNLKALFRRGKAYSAMNDNEKAKEDLTKAMTIDKTDSEIRQELAKVKEKLLHSKKKEQQFYGGIFDKLSKPKDGEEGLYADAQPEPEPKTKLCRICNEEIETVQWARHVIKKHGKK